MRASAKAASAALNRGLGERGIDLMSRMSGVTSAAHTDDDLARTLDAFEATVREMADTGIFTG